MKIEVGKTYRFDPPVKAAGIYEGGRIPTLYLGLSFAIGECIGVDTTSIPILTLYKFRGVYGGETYSFFANADNTERTVTMVADSDPPLLR